MKAFLEQYGLGILAAIIVIVLIMMISPLGLKVKESHQHNVSNIDYITQNGLETAYNETMQSLGNLANETEEEKHISAWSAIEGKQLSDVIWWNNNKSMGSVNGEVYQQLREMDNEKRKQADQEILDDLAKFFSAQSDERLSEILGTQYSRIKSSGGVLFSYRVDNNTYSVMLNPDTATNNIDYLKALDYNPRVYVTRPGSAKIEDGFIIQQSANNYVNMYLFTSDDVIDKLSATNQVWIKITKDAQGNNEASLWIRRNNIVTMRSN